MSGNIGVVSYLNEELRSAREAFLRAAEESAATGEAEQRANNLNNAGIMERRLGQYDEALQHIQEAIRIHRELENRKKVASGRNNIANIQEERGQFRAALRNLRGALGVNRALGDSGDVAMNLNNIGLILRSQGKYAEALDSHRRALQLHRQVSDSSSVADALNNLGLVLKKQGHDERALARYRESLRINRKLGNRLETATNLNNVGQIELRQGRYAEARRAIQNALQISRELEDRPGVAASRATLAEVDRREGALQQAAAGYRAALRINRELGRREAEAENLYGLGQVHLERGQYDRADSVLTRTVRITDALLETASGADRRDYLAQEAHSFQVLVTARVRADRPASALRAFERGRARLLAERLSEQDRPEKDQIPSARQLRATVGPERAAVLYANTDTERPLTALVVTPDTIRAREIPDSSLVQRTLEQYQDGLGRLRLREELALSSSASSVLLQEAKGLGERATGEEGLSALVRLYRHDLRVSSGRQVLSDGRHRVLGKYLHELLLAPLEEMLLGREELIVVPDGALGYLPFETLADWEGEYLIQRRRVRYVQSLRVLRLLQQRSPERPEREGRVLALGGGVYDAPTYAADTANQAASQIAGRRRVGEGSWPNLPWSLREVTRIGELAPSAHLLTGPDVREDSLRRLNEGGMLRRYRALHFATHGLVVPEAPSRSALVLSGAPSPRPDTSGLDGYLTVDEIVGLNLNAEFVALSACQTGMGRIYRGTGVVSLAQAFLRAGSNATAVSLWSVYDASTQVFMEAMYRRVWQYGQSWNRALAETKRAFLDGDHGERLRDPRFWAPFVYYGRGGQ
jgi:CHAT domain-containing protein